MQCKWVPHSQERWTTFCGLPLTSTVNHGSASGKRQNANSSLSKVIKVPFFQTFTAEKRDINRSSKNQPSLWISLWDLTAPLSKFDNRDWTRSTTSSESLARASRDWADHTTFWASRPARQEPTSATRWSSEEQTYTSRGLYLRVPD